MLYQTFLTVFYQNILYIITSLSLISYSSIISVLSYRPPAWWQPPLWKRALSQRCCWLAPRLHTGWTSSGCPAPGFLHYLLWSPRWSHWTGSSHQSCTPCSPPDSPWWLHFGGASWAPGKGITGAIWDNCVECPCSFLCECSTTF